jgi:phenylpropionate dioxygenase-like ring-hydroxylating dioxygenase large terminal subunit
MLELQEYWYVACASSRLQADPKAVRVLDKDIVLFRDSEGTPRALLNRCCHRGVKLSLGRITNGNLACGYHGWQYNGSGKCVHVPSLPESSPVPEHFCVPAFKCVEQDGYIWVWTGKGEPDPIAPDRIPEFDQYGWLQGVSPAACSAMMLIENQFDSAHPAFAHVGTHPSYYASLVSGLREYEYEVRVTDTGMVSFYPTTKEESDPIPEKVKTLTQFELPSRVYVYQKFLGMNFCIVLHIVPTGPNTCRMEWMQRQKPGITGMTWVEQETKLIEQDRVLLESAQTWYDLSDDFERSVSADFVTVLVRKVMAMAGTGNWKQNCHQLPKRRLVHLRG